MAKSFTNVKFHQLKSHDIAINVFSVKNIFSCKHKLTLKASWSLIRDNTLALSRDRFMTLFNLHFSLTRAAKNAS